MRIFRLIPFIACLLGGVLSGGERGLFPLSDVRLLDGPFKHAQDLDREYLLALDVDRLLAPYYTEAGLKPKAVQYPNWESSGLNGHIGGHYISAVAQMYAATGDAEMKRRLDAMVSGLAECQRANGDGYVGGVPGGREMWKEIAAGNIKAGGFSLNGKWVPWYNLHKVFAGLRDAWCIAGNAQAREVLVALTDWCDALTANLTDAQMQDMLRCEPGGMNEVLADVYAITGDQKYLRLAERFSDQAILDSLLHREDKLTGLHANTQIPKVIGYARIAELGGPADWTDAAKFFWDNVVTYRSVAIGGNSVREHFHATNDFSPMIESREGPETCNTYNMLRLTEQLLNTLPMGIAASYYERALYNHILASQHPEHGGLVYFTSMRPRHYRVYSQPQECFWCCVGSGIENHGKYGRYIYAHEKDKSGTDILYVNLFIASELNWKDRDVRIRQETQFPDESNTALVVHIDKDAAGTSTRRFILRGRVPDWSKTGEMRVKVNGTAVKVPTDPYYGLYFEIDREWTEGDRVEISMSMFTYFQILPDSSPYVAIMHGPLMLAAKTSPAEPEGLIAGDGRMAHVAPGPYLPLDTSPMIVTDGNFKGAPPLQPVPGRPLTFTASQIIRPDEYRDLVIEPFFRVHDARAMTYWRWVQPGQYESVLAEIAAKEKVRSALEARILDQVYPGEQQPEVEHRLAGEDMGTGITHGRKWRNASQWFSYELTPGTGTRPTALQVTYHAGERNRQFDILINDRLIASVDWDSRKPDQFSEVEYPLPADLAAAPKLVVKFVAREKSKTAAIFGVRLLSQAADEASP